MGSIGGILVQSRRIRYKRWGIALGLRWGVENLWAVPEAQCR